MEKKCLICGVAYEPKRRRSNSVCSGCWKSLNPGAFVNGDNMGENNHKWKGEKANYGSVHDYINYHYGQPQTCEHCPAKNLGVRKHQWANISGSYSRDRSDWLRLCAKCHFKFDGRDSNLSKYQKAKIKHSSRPNGNNSGYKNVRVDKNRYRAYISVNGKQKSLGSYSTPQEAYEVYKETALELYGTY